MSSRSARCWRRSKLLNIDGRRGRRALLLTATRAVFVGARGVSVPWHGVSACVREQRDLLLVSRKEEAAPRIPFNTHGDALRAAWIAFNLQSANR